MVSPNFSEPVPADVVAFGHEVARRRRMAGMTLEQLAEATRVSRQTIINIENAHKVARIDTAHALAQALDVPLSELVKTLSAPTGEN